MTSRKTASSAPPAGFEYLPGVSGWCLSNQHEFCPRDRCTCTRCPGVHHTKAGQAPRVYSTHDTMPQSALDLLLEEGDDVVVDVPVPVAEAA